VSGIKHSVAVIGGGPAGLMAAEVLAGCGIRVVVYDRTPSAGRKLLLAGRGGLNLTHSEPLSQFLARYGNAEPRLRAAIESFSPERARAWCEALGQKTFVGSSGRVFPTVMKASPLLRAWLARLAGAGVEFSLRHQWQGFDADGALRFTTPAGPATARHDAVVLALGGASWPKLGSDGGWAPVMAEAGIKVAPLQPANCGFLVNWSDVFRTRAEGQPLKRIALSFAGQTVRGECVITRQGIEGGAIYALSALLRDAVLAEGDAVLHVDLLPDISAGALEQKLAQPRGKQSLATFLRKQTKLSAAAIALIQEAAIAASRQPTTMGPHALAALIKAVPVKLTGVAPLANAISTAGGIAFDEVDENFMLRRKPGVFVAGEMLDWEAPTGGYLLQACFATGRAAGEGVARWLAQAKATLVPQ
jgi:uncharacterized flavoprotein (TIGR03862 family)